ncbi:MAG: DUF4065 domain-containing protein [Ignavibacteria bacterium]|nr:DUF4065 domain-containing protein [Ignavibacteria bacterium]
MAAAKDILLEILAEAREKDLSLGKTQLIKLLYLVEVEHYRETGQRLTHINWIFYLYGPYAHDLEGILADRVFERDDIKTGAERDFISYRIAEPEKTYQRFVDAKVSLTVKKIVGVWGKCPLPELLDYVYFETEPMQKVKGRGERLDFETIHRSPREQIYTISASKDARKKVEALRKRVKSYLETFSETHQLYLHRDKDELEAIEEWDAPQENTNLSDIAVKLSSDLSNADNPPS